MVKILATIVFAAVCGSTWAQSSFIAEYDAAKKLAPEESEAALSKLAETAPKKVRDDVLALAAEKATMQKKYDVADKYLAQITDKNVQAAAKINVLTLKKDWNGIISFAKDLKLEEYPDKLIPKVAYQRAQAYGFGKDKAAAYKDLELAIKLTGNPPDKAEMINEAVAMAGTCFGDHAKQIEFLDKLSPNDMEKLPIGPRQRIISMHADVLVKQGKAEDAIKYLNDNAKFVDKVDSYIYMIKMSYAAAYLAKGDKANAAKYYTEASKLEKLPDGWAEQAKAKAQALTK